MDNAEKFIELEKQYGANNYKPLDVVVEKADGIWLYDVNGKKYNVIGEIGLSHTAIDITDSDVKIGDVASVEISPLMVNPNVPRIYK